MFYSSSYVDAEKRKRAELGIDVESVPLQLQDNTELATAGIYTSDLSPHFFGKAQLLFF